MKTLTWSHLRIIGKNGKGGKWYPVEEVAEYFSGIRAPSHAWPHSYAKAAMTAKFAKWLLANKPELANSLGVGA